MRFFASVVPGNDLLSPALAVRAAGVATGVGCGVAVTATAAGRFGDGAATGKDGLLLHPLTNVMITAMLRASFFNR